MTAVGIFFITVSIALSVTVGAGVWAVSAYNRLVRLRNSAKNAYAQIDVQLKRRYDLIPNLVEVARKYMAHERETLEAVIGARNQARTAAQSAQANPGSAQTMLALGAAEQVLGGALGRLLATVEAYPDLKADKSMSDMSEELISTENRIGFARQGFNDAVLDYNNTVEQFPARLIASIFEFTPAAMLESTSGAVERQAVKVAF